MRRFLIFLFLGATAAFGIWFGMRGGSAKISASAVSTLLPRETLAFVHLPDFKGSRAQWHETEFYKLWREPAVQDFLQRPLARVPQSGAARQRLQEFAALEMKDAFLAITSWENKELKMAGGFRFKGTAENAEKVIGQWRTQIQANAPNAKRETVTHEQHRIEVTSQDAITIATVYDGNWFFAANDVPTLKTLLDRADKRANDPATTLSAEADFIASSKHMPAKYAVRAYGRLDRYFEKLATALPQDGSASKQMAFLRQVRSVSAATAFENGKIRDVLFLAMPKMGEMGDLARTSLTLATRDSFLYAASFLNFPKEMPQPNAAALTGGYAAGLQPFLATIAANGVTLESWNSAFATEFGIIGEWPASARMPAFFATLPVKDAAKAKEIVGAITTASGQTRPWKISERDGVQYYTQAPANAMVPITPTVAVSNQLLVLGHDPAAIDLLIKRSASTSSDLAGSEAFKAAERLVPAAKHSFSYLDAALLYRRLDAALRPMLVMAAAFMPGIAETVDLSKLPEAEVVARHLGPLAVSQSYVTDGYVTESIGPVSIYQAVLGIAATTGAGASLYQSQMQGSSGSALTIDPPDDPSALPSPSPDETP